MKIKMVVGFMFNEKETDVLLIEKKKPKWQSGKFNGIGGKVEQGEFSHSAMVREFKEETGIISNETDWRQVILIGGDDWEVQIFACKSDNVFDLKTMEEETVNLLPLNELDSYDLISNLYWLIPMSLDALHGQINYDIQNVPTSPSYSGADMVTFKKSDWNNFKSRLGARSYQGLINIEDLVKITGELEDKNL